jgi:hypothetical protein
MKLRVLLLTGFSALALPLVGSAQASTIVYTNAAAFAAATTTPTTMGFSGVIVPPATFVGFSSLTVGPATFTDGNPVVTVNVTSKSYYAPSFTYAADFLVPASNADPSQVLNISLPAGTHALALDFGRLFSNGATTILLSNGYSLSDPATPSQGNTEFVGFVSSDLITTLRLTVPGDAYVLEDLVLAAIPVPAPEPAGMALLSVGLIGLLATRRRR